MGGGGEFTKNDAKCYDVMTALNPTTGTNAAKTVPKTTCEEKVTVQLKSRNFM